MSISIDTEARFDIIGIYTRGIDQQVSIRGIAAMARAMISEAIQTSDTRAFSDFIRWPIHAISWLTVVDACCCACLDVPFLRCIARITDDVIVNAVDTVSISAISNMTYQKIYVKLLASEYQTAVFYSCSLRCNKRCRPRSVYCPQYLVSNSSSSI